MPGDALLLVLTDVDPAWESEFNQWYDEEHVPDLLGVPGVLAARRYRAIEGEPRYMAVYDLADTSVVEGPEYQRVRAWGPGATDRSRRIFASFRNMTRGVYRRILTLPDPEPSDLSAAEFLLLRGLEVDPGQEEEFQDWYNTEHFPNISRVPAVLRCRRFKLYPGASGLMGNPAIYMALYDVKSPDVEGTAEWKQATDTPWTLRMRRKFTRRQRVVYRRILPRG